MLQGLINEERNKPAPTGPPTPVPIFEELQHLIKVASVLEGIEISSVTLKGGAGSSVRVDVTERRLQNTFRTALNEDSQINWSPKNRAATNRSLTLSGNWNRRGN